jgi:hypothetical protein
MRRKADIARAGIQRSSFQALRRGRRRPAADDHHGERCRESTTEGEQRKAAAGFQARPGHYPNAMHCGAGAPREPMQSASCRTTVTLTQGADYDAAMAFK